jgi:chromosome segregation protein
VFVEEAAGITKFKTKKAQALKKLEQTTANLKRVNDILGEVDGQLGSLERQAKKAERFITLKAELQAVELHGAALKSLEFKTILHFLHSQSNSAESQVSEQSQSAEQLETGVETQRQALAELDQNIGLHQAMLFEAQNAKALATQELAHIESSIENLQRLLRQASDEMKRLSGRGEQLSKERALFSKERANLSVSVAETKAELDAAIAEYDGAQAAVVEARRALATLEGEHSQEAQKSTQAQMKLQAFTVQREVGEARRRTLDADLDRLHDNEQELLKRADVARQELGAVSEQLRGNTELQAQQKIKENEIEKQRAFLSQEREGLREALMKKSSRLSSLEEVEKALQHHSDGASFLLKRRTDLGMLHCVAELMEATAEAEAVLEGTLRHRIEAVLVKDAAQALKLSELVKNEKKGRVRFLCTDSAQGAACERPTSFEGHGFFLSDGISAAGQHATSVKQSLSGFFVVNSDDEALALWPAAIAAHVHLVTPKGDILCADGSILGGSAKSGRGLLSHKREIKALTSEVSELKVKLPEIESRLAELNQTVASLKAEQDNSRSTEQNLKLSIARLESFVREREMEAARAKTQRNSFLTEVEGLSAALAKTEEEMGPMKRLWSESLERMGELASRQVAMKAEVGALDADAQAKKEIATTLRIDSAKVQERKEQLERSDSQIEQNLKDIELQLINLKNNEQDHSQKLAELAGSIDAKKEKISAAAAEESALNDALSESRAKRATIEQTIQVKASQLAAARKALDEAKDLLQGLKIRSAENELALSMLEKRITERYKIELDAILTDYHLLNIPTVDPTKRVAELERAIDALGGINTDAINEFNELKKRQGFLFTQSADLTEAISQLEAALRKVDNTTRVRFKEAFEAINSRFGQVFPRLFRGGKAWLALTNPDDLLNTGVEIYAEPPGKKLASIALMSGGEKALTAVSLIFSIFLMKPSPFCLLDEVDAPLDEGNVERFNQILREMSKISQFIVITHNRRTMEVVDRLYGVTMEEPGASRAISLKLDNVRESIDKKGARDIEIHAHAQV